MEDVAALQRTVRRCTALVLLAVAVLVGTVDPGQFWVAAVAASGCVVYLLGSFVFVSNRAVSSEAAATDR